MSKPEEFLKKLASAFVDMKENRPEEFDAMLRRSAAGSEEMEREMEGLSPDEAFDLGIAKATGSQAFGPLCDDLGRDGEGERFELLLRYMRRGEIPTPEAKLGAEQLGMTVDEFRERVRFMNERLEHHFRNVVAEMNEPEYVEEETQYLMGLLDRAARPRPTH